MSDLDIDTDQLRAIAERIALVGDTLDRARSDAHQAALHVGHERLAGTVRDFADGWSIHRRDAVAELRALAALCTAVHETFSDLEGNTARALRGATAGAGGSTAPTPTPTYPARLGTVAQ